MIHCPSTVPVLRVTIETTLGWADESQHSLLINREFTDWPIRRQHSEWECCGKVSICVSFRERNFNTNYGSLNSLLNLCSPWWIQSDAFIRSRGKNKPLDSAINNPTLLYEDAQTLEWEINTRNKSRLCENSAGWADPPEVTRNHERGIRISFIPYCRTRSPFDTSDVKYAVVWSRHGNVYCTKAT